RAATADRAAERAHPGRRSRRLRLRAATRHGSPSPTDGDDVIRHRLWPPQQRLEPFPNPAWIGRADSPLPWIASASTRSLQRFRLCMQNLKTSVLVQRAHSLRMDPPAVERRWVVRPTDRRDRHNQATRSTYASKLWKPPPRL